MDSSICGSDVCLIPTGVNVEDVWITSAVRERWDGGAGSPRDYSKDEGGVATE